MMPDEMIADELTASESGLVLKVENLAKTYALGFFRKKVKAIVDVNVEVRQGEIFGLLGPNGAGKTTTLKIIMGLVRPTSGSVELLGQPIDDQGAKKRIGYLPENPYFYDYLSGRELLAFVGHLFDLPRATIQERSEKLIKDVDMGHAADLALRRYSKGMMQRIGIAQALMNDPDLVILDEPLTGLDPLGRKHLRDLIADLRQRGKTVIISSHILADVELLADRVAILVKGKTVDTGPLSQLVDARTLNTEIIVRQADPSLNDAINKWQGSQASIEEVEEGWRIVVEGDQQNDQAIELIQEHGGKIVSVIPRKESLEDVVVRRATADAPQQGAPQ
jgi:ABC-2 type transport system ATP-binding protein